MKALEAVPPLDGYARIVGHQIIDELKELAGRLKGLTIQEINSTRMGGGVAEILSSFVPFLKELGFDVRWDTICAEPDFFGVTKTLHNFLQGKEGFSLSHIKTYWDTLEKNIGLIDEDCEVVTIHDPQPAGLIKYLSEKSRRKQRLIWRCHVHLESVSLAKMIEIEWFLKEIVEKYDASIFSTFHFLPLWRIVSFVIPPYIDPLSEKNMDLSQGEIDGVLGKYGMSLEKPLITQVSRFDIFKDPLGVIAAFKIVREKHPCQMLLVGGGAIDDPEYQQVLSEVRGTAGNDADIHILDLPADSHREINAFQRASSVIVQKSVKEGFGLTVSEGFWKGKPVVGGNAGGIPLQIRDGWNGFLASSVEETAERITYLLKNPEVAEEMGRRGKEYVTHHFLVPRGIRDYLATIDQLISGSITSKHAIISYHPWLPPTGVPDISLKPA